MLARSRCLDSLTPYSLFYLFTFLITFSYKYNNGSLINEKKVCSCSLKLLFTYSFSLLEPCST